MKANGGTNLAGKDRKRKISAEKADEQDRTNKVPQSASRRHREKINATLEELGGLLPLQEESRSKLDKLTVLKLSVSFFQTHNYLQSGKRRRKVDDAAVSEVTKKLEACNINVSDISLEALDSFFLVLSDSADVFFVSENVYRYLGYTQTFLMHQNFLNFVHHEDVVGFERCLRQAAKARIIELDDGIDCKELEEQPIPQVCFCSIRCHAGRQSSHVSPFYYRSFKFDGNIKPLLNGKMKQYGYFALCTPVNPANPFTSTPKELVLGYSCKLGLDLSVKKLDNRGQKNLYFNEKDILARTGYFFVHPDDVQLMILGHEKVVTDGHCETVFRLMNGRGKWQWVRGKARILYDKNDQPEGLATDNIFLTEEQGPYFQKVAYELLREWRSRQKSLPLPGTHNSESSEENSPDLALPPSSATSESMSPNGQGSSAPSDDGMLQESKDNEIIEFSPPIMGEEKKAHVLPSIGPTTGASESCMFSSPHMNTSPVEEKPNILAHDGMVFNFKAEHRNGTTAHANPKPNHTAHDQINLIKQFLMGEDNHPPPNSCQHQSAVQVEGGLIRDSPLPWDDVDASSVLSELKFQHDDRSSVPFPPYPPQNGIQPSLHVNGFDHIPDILQGHASVSQPGKPQHPDTTNLIYPFLPDMSDHTNASMSSPHVNGMQEQDVCNVHVEMGFNNLNQVLQNGTDCLPPYLRQEGTVVHSLQERLKHNQNGFYQPHKESNFPTVSQRATENNHTYDYMGHASATGLPGQDPNLWFGSSSAAQFNHSSQVHQAEDVLSVDDLTPSLFTGPAVPCGNPENFHNGHFTVRPASVYPSSEKHLNQSAGQSFQSPQNVQQKQVNGSRSQNFQPGSNNSILKMMLTL